MDIINEMTKIIEFSELLKTENGEVHEELELKEEEIKKLLVDLAQKSNEVFGLHSNLDDQQNGLKSKLMNRDQQIEELKKQIDHSKINHIVALENEVAILKKENKEHNQMIGFLYKTFEEEGYNCEVTDDGDFKWSKESQTIGTMTAPDDLPEVRKRVKAQTSAYQKKRAKMNPTTYQERENNFTAFIHLHYSPVKPSLTRKQAVTPFGDIYKKIKEVSGSDTSSPAFLLKGEYAHWPSKEKMVNLLKQDTIDKYPNIKWDCSAAGRTGYHGCSDITDNRRFDLKLNK